MFDQMHVPPDFPVLSALLEHPDFQRGLTHAKESFLEDYEEAPLTEEEMLDAVEMELSRPTVQRSRLIARLEGWPPSSYFYNLGYLMGTINEGLTYAR